MTTTADTQLTLDTFWLSDETLNPLKDQLYKPDSPGYVIFENFLSPEQVNHLCHFWMETPPDSKHFDVTPTLKKKIGQRNFIFEGKMKHVYFNYIWNKPFDELSHQICYVVTLLRNQLEGSPIYHNLLPNGPRMSAYRFIVSKNVPGIEVEPHTDFLESQYKDEPRAPFYLQATLFLSDYGKDYEGDGFIFTSTQGDVLRFGPDIPVKAGDLIIWRYCNVHSIGSTKTPEGGKGFVRMIFPFDEIDVPEYKADPPALILMLQKAVKKVTRKLQKLGVLK